MPPADVPVRVRKPVVRVRARKARVRQPVVQVAERLPEIPDERTIQPFDADAVRHSFILKGYEGKTPLCRLRGIFTPRTVCRKPPADVPVRARKPDDRVRARKARVRQPVAQAAERQPLVVSARDDFLVNSVSGVCGGTTATDRAAHQLRNGRIVSEALQIVPAFRGGIWQAVRRFLVVRRDRRCKLGRVPAHVVRQYADIILSRIGKDRVGNDLVAAVGLLNALQLVRLLARLVVVRRTIVAENSIRASGIPLHRRPELIHGGIERVCHVEIHRLVRRAVDGHILNARDLRAIHNRALRGLAAIRRRAKAHRRADEQTVSLRGRDNDALHAAFSDGRMHVAVVVRAAAVHDVIKRQACVLDVDVQLHPSVIAGTLAAIVAVRVELPRNHRPLRIVADVPNANRDAGNAGQVVAKAVLGMDNPAMNGAVQIDSFGDGVEALLSLLIAHPVGVRGIVLLVPHPRCHLKHADRARGIVPDERICAGDAVNSGDDPLAAACKLPVAVNDREELEQRVIVLTSYRVGRRRTRHAGVVANLRAGGEARLIGIEERGAARPAVSAELVPSLNDVGQIGADRASVRLKIRFHHCSIVFAAMEQ